MHSLKYSIKTYYTLLETTYLRKILDTTLSSYDLQNHHNVLEVAFIA